jgi:hypothetical protein
LVLVPEFLEWTQPTIGGPPRTFPILQKRVCFTELSPKELAAHADRFGHFSLEFEIETVRKLGAMPVFYVPQPTSEMTDGSLVGSALVAIATDMRAVIQRLAGLSRFLHGDVPVAPKLDFDVGFVGSPEGRGKYAIDRDEAKNLLAAIGHAVTPWSDLAVGADALLNFFYPTDNKRTDAALEYYRQREWRIACGFRLKGRDGRPDVDLTRVLTAQERQRLQEIDQEFFSRKVKTGIGEADTLDQALVLPGLDSRRIIQMVRRVIAPASAVRDAVALLADLDDPPSVVALEELSDARRVPSRPANPDAVS